MANSSTKLPNASMVRLLKRLKKANPEVEALVREEKCWSLLSGRARINIGDNKASAVEALTMLVLLCEQPIVPITEEESRHAKWIVDYDAGGGSVPYLHNIEPVCQKVSGGQT